MVHHPAKKHDTRTTNNIAKDLPIIKKIESNRLERIVIKSQPATYRNFYDIIFDLMYMAKVTDGQITKARAAVLARLSYAQIKNYLIDILVPYGLVDEDPETGFLKVTQKGKEYMESHEKTRLILGMESYETKLSAASPWMPNSPDQVKLVSKRPNANNK